MPVAAEQAVADEIGKQFGSLFVGDDVVVNGPEDWRPESEEARVGGEGVMPPVVVTEEGGLRRLDSYNSILHLRVVLIEW